MKVTADTNVLVRAAINDDPVQAPLARALLQDAESIVLTLPVLCEFVWVTRSVYRRHPEEISASLRQLIAAPNIEVDVAATEAGLATLEAGGDFADGAIAFVGRCAGGPVFVSFDKKAVELIIRSGGEALLLGVAAK